MKVCILKSDQVEFVQLMEMYNIDIEIIDSIEYSFDDRENDVEYIYSCKMKPNQKNHFFNWFELGQMFERQKFEGHRKSIENMKKQLLDKLNDIPDATI